MYQHQLGKVCASVISTPTPDAERPWGYPKFPPPPQPRPRFWQPTSFDDMRLPNNDSRQRFTILLSTESTRPNKRVQFSDDITFIDIPGRPSTDSNDSNTSDNDDQFASEPRQFFPTRWQPPINNPSPAIAVSRPGPTTFDDIIDPPPEPKPIRGCGIWTFLKRFVS